MLNPLLGLQINPPPLKGQYRDPPPCRIGTLHTYVHRCTVHYMYLFADECIQCYHENVVSKDQLPSEQTSDCHTCSLSYHSSIEACSYACLETDPCDPNADSAYCFNDDDATRMCTGTDVISCLCRDADGCNYIQCNAMFFTNVTAGAPRPPTTSTHGPTTTIVNIVYGGGPKTYQIQLGLIELTVCNAFLWRVNKGLTLKA